MRVAKMLLLTLLLAALLGGCRFAVVESDSVHIEAPTAVPQAEAPD